MRQVFFTGRVSQLLKPRRPEEQTLEKLFKELLSMKVESLGCAITLVGIRYHANISRDHQGEIIIRLNKINSIDPYRVESNPLTRARH